MNVLVTGGAGFIGSHLAEALLAEGHRVAVVDNLSTGKRENIPAEAHFYEIDIRDAALGKVFAEEKPDVVCHHAAQMSVLISMREPTHDASHNIIGSLNVLGCAQASGVKRLIFASSGGTVYGEPQTLPVTEDHPTVPLSPYGISKLSFEHYLRISEVPHTILRYANVYGPRQNPHGEAGVISIFAERMTKGEEAFVFGDGEQMRDFVYVSDVVAANLAVIAADANGTFNIGTGYGTSINEIYDAVAKATGYPPPRQHLPAKAGEVYRIILDVNRAHTKLGWQATVDLPTGIQQTVV